MEAGSKPGAGSWELLGSVLGSWMMDARPLPVKKGPAPRGHLEMAGVLPRWALGVLGYWALGHAGVGRCPRETRRVSRASHDIDGCRRPNGMESSAHN